MFFLPRFLSALLEASSAKSAVNEAKLIDTIALLKSQFKTEAQSMLCAAQPTTHTDHCSPCEDSTTTSIEPCSARPECSARSSPATTRRLLESIKHVLVDARRAAQSEHAALRNLQQNALVTRTSRGAVKGGCGVSGVSCGELESLRALQKEKLVFARGMQRLRARYERRGVPVTSVEESADCG